MGKEEVTFPIQKDELESIFNNLESKVIRVKTISMTKVKNTKNIFSSKLKNMMNKKSLLLTI